MNSTIIHLKMRKMKNKSHEQQYFAVAFIFMDDIIILSLKRGVTMTFDIDKLQWTREPEDYKLSADKIEIITECKWLAHNGQQPDSE